MKKIVTYLYEHWKEISAIVAAILALLAGAYAVTSCGSTTRALVRNNATGTQTEVKITTNNPTSVTATPNIEVNPSTR